MMMITKDKGHKALISLRAYIGLSTKTKMFCSCRLSYGDEINTNTCPICLGHPGTLPVLNRKAADMALMVALALNCKVRRHNLFYRKNYFDPSLSKNYQISQLGLPLAEEGQLEIEGSSGKKRVGISRISMEEGGASIDAKTRIADFNTSGTPFVEVTSKEISSSKDARQYIKELRELILSLGVGECNIKKGSLRIEAELTTGSLGKGPVLTLTNIASIGSLGRALKVGLEQHALNIANNKKISRLMLRFDSDNGLFTPSAFGTDYENTHSFLEPDLEPICFEEKKLKDIELKVKRLLDKTSKGSL
jgi:aspartyl-tRNA(Asn)/glutamyl-tRNA(Gln) amidotransferase subunit B